MSNVMPFRGPGADREFVSALRGAVEVLRAQLGDVADAIAWLDEGSAGDDATVIPIRPPNRPPRRPRAS
jgi:hypothetical protein